MRLGCVSTRLSTEWAVISHALREHWIHELCLIADSSRLRSRAKDARRGWVSESLALSLSVRSHIGKFGIDAAWARCESTAPPGRQSRGFCRLAVLTLLNKLLLKVWPMRACESLSLSGVSSRRARGSGETWLILPVVICLSQRLSHACLSISFYTAKLRMAH